MALYFAECDCAYDCTFSLNIGVVVLTTSSLSFLGLGVAPDVAEWGNILRTGSNYLETHSNLAIVPYLYYVRRFSI